MTPDRSVDWARAFAQQLTALKSAGLTHLRRSRSAAPLAAGAAGGSLPDPAAAAGAVLSAPAGKATSAGRVPPGPARAPGRVAPPATLFEPQPQAPPVPQDPREPSPDRRRQLEVVNNQVRNCTRCAELSATRTQTVFGVGDPNARIVFVGEAPGADEDQQGEPFVGRAGQLLNQIIAACRLKREEIYICNILKCRPPQNRAPTPTEAANCAEYLAAQLAIIDPDFIVCWGAVAAQNLLKTTASIGKLRGRFHALGRAQVICTYHPSYLLRCPWMKKDCWEDMKLFMARLGIDPPRKSES